MSVHGFDLGSLDLTSALPHESGCTFSIIAAGATFGSPDASVKTLVSMLADGDLARYDRAGNRVASFQVQISAPDGQSLVDGEVALRRELYGPNTVTWTPPDVLAPSTVYEVLTSSMEPKFDDLDELRTRRVFQVTLTCAPFARSVDPVTVEALLASGAAVTVDTCDSATGWAATVNGAAFAPDPAWLGQTGKLYVVEVSNPGPQVMTLTRLTDFAVSSPYLQISVHGNEPQQTTASATIDGVARELQLLETRKSPTVSDEWLFTFAISGTTVNDVTFTNVSQGDFAAFGISVVSFVANPPGVSARQLTRVVGVNGTERTPASIHVESVNGSDDLGLALVYTCPEDGSGYSPPMRRWRTQGNGTPTTDTNTFSGKYEPIHPQSFEAQVATTALPSGGYQLVAALACSSVSTRVISWSTGTIPPGGTDREGLVEGSTVVSFAAANTWQLVALGDPLSLPSVRTTSGLVQIGILRDDPSNGALPTVQLDELWLFRVDDDCHLSVVDCDEPHLWLDSPDVAASVPTTWIGASSDARRHPGVRLKAQGNHHLLADGTALFTATRNTNYPKASATFFDRYHSNAAT